MLAERLEAKTGYSQYLVKNLSPSLFPFLLLVLSFLPGLTGFDVAESRVGGSDGLKTLLFLIPVGFAGESAGQSCRQEH